MSTSSEDRILTTVVYVLYFVAPFFCGVTALIGAVVAYVRRPLSGVMERSHYAFQIRILWTFVAVFLLALAAAIVGLILVITHGNGTDDYFAPSLWQDAAFVSGLVLLVASGLAFAADILWLMLASVFGVARLLSGEPIGRLRGA